MTNHILYSLHTDGDQYRITKFVDGNVESSYLSTQYECQCPAGHRPSCRHRQMIPDMLAHGIVDTHWFYNFDIRRVVDFNGELKSNLDAMNELAAERAAPPAEVDLDEVELIEPMSHMGNGIPHLGGVYAKDITPVGEAPPSNGQVVPAGPLNPLSVAAGPPAEPLADLPSAHSAHSGDDIGRMTLPAPKAWRRM